jgi:hypothetical protein
MMFLGANLSTMGAPGDNGDDGTVVSAGSLAFAGGDGSESNPYQITNVTELQNMSSNVTAQYVLKNNIDASATVGWNSGAGFLPVGNATSKFNGSFDGNGYSISSLTIDRTGEDYVGLFGYNDGARVHNLTLSSIKIQGRNRVGGICGQSLVGTIENCTVVGSVEGLDYVGGVVGVVTGEVKDCQASARVSGDESVGGMAGYSNAAITRCASDQKVTGIYRRVGGFVGNVAGGTVSDSFSYGDVDSTGRNCVDIGGFAGISAGTISSCHSTGSVTSTLTSYYAYRFGGFVAYNTGAVSKCYSLGSVSVSLIDERDAYLSEIGGFVGYNTGTVNYSYAKGSVKGSTALTETYGMMNYCQYIGGFAGHNRGTISSSYSTGSSSGSATAAYEAYVSGIGGFSGYNYGTISNCYSTGSASGHATGRYGRVSSVGGMVGAQGGSISYCYSTGTASATVVGTYASSYSIGGFYGSTSRASTSCFWDVYTSGTTTATGSGTSSGISGNTTSEMMTRMTFEDAAWDFNDTWVIIENLTYPCLNGIYRRPIIDIFDHQMVVEDIPVKVSYDVSISDYPWLNREKTVASSSNASAWLTWDEMERTFTGTPTNAEVGTYWLNISAEDLCGGIGWTNVTLDVLNVNDPPTITTVDVVVTPEDAEYSVDYDAEDIDPTNDTLTWNLSTVADWLTMNTTTGQLTGTPTNDHVGTHSVTISVTDGNGGVTARTFRLLVENTNDDPVINTIDLQVADEDEAYSVHYRATDVDPTGDQFTWNVVTDAPWLTMTENNLYGTPGNEHVGDHWVNVSVSDGNGGEDSTNFTLTVINVNDAPVITTEDVTAAMEDELYSVDYEADDIDPTADQMVWNLVTGPGWLEIDPATGVLSGTPTNDDLGSYLVTVRALDGRGGRDLRTFMLTVENANDDPVIITTPRTSAREDEAYALFLEATDVDPTRDTFTWTMDTDAEWLSLDDNRLTGVPTNEDVGEFLVNVTAVDGNGGTTSFEFTLTVTNTNDNPVITSTPLHAFEDEAYSFTMEADDPDTGDTLEWAMEPGGTWLSIDAVTGELTGTPTNDDVGSHYVLIVVTDGIAQASRGFTITVTNTNDAPEWDTVPADVTVEEGTPMIGRARALDMDGDPVSYTMTSEPAAEGMVIGAVSGEIAWYDTVPGTYLVTVTASDGEEDVDHTYTITVSKKPKAVEDEGLGNAGLYAIIAVLLVLVVFLVLRQMAGSGSAPVVEPEEDVLVEDEVGTMAEEETEAEAVDGPEEEEDKE